MCMISVVPALYNPPPSPLSAPLALWPCDDGVEYILRVLQVKKIPFTSYDMASDEDAKKLWRRKAPLSECQDSFV